MSRNFSKDELYWKKPKQQRGIDRVDKILDSARCLIVDEGSLNIALTQVAKGAGIPIGSLYQFFPTRESLLYRLFELEMTEIDSLFDIKVALDTSSSVEIDQHIEALIKKTVEIVEENTLLKLMWSGINSYPVIREADFANTRQNASALASQLSNTLKNDDVSDKQYYPFALLVCDLWGSVIQLYFALESQQERDSVIAEFTEMVKSRIDALIRD